MRTRENSNPEQVEKMAMIVCHSLALNFRVYNQTREELLQIREEMATSPKVTGDIQILLQGNRVL